MIAFIKGILADAGENRIVVEGGSVGYELYVSAQTLGSLPAVGGEIKVHTYLQVREDAMQLFGFLTKDELELFKLLIGVNGIGPKAALSVLSAISADDLRFAVLSEDIKTISAAPGIGKKTAQKLILELKDKLSLEDAFEKRLAGQSEPTPLPAASDARGEAVQALVALGYSNSDALKAVSQVDSSEDMDVESILKSALKKIAR